MNLISTHTDVISLQANLQTEFQKQLEFRHLAWMDSACPRRYGTNHWWLGLGLGYKQEGYKRQKMGRQRFLGALCYSTLGGLLMTSLNIYIMYVYVIYSIYSLTVSCMHIFTIATSPCPSLSPGTLLTTSSFYLSNTPYVIVLPAGMLVHLIDLCL